MLLNKVLYFVLALASTNILSQNAHTYCNVTCVSFQVQYFYNYCLIVFITVSIQQGGAAFILLAKKG